MKLFDKRDLAFKTGLSIAKKYKKIKYELYLYEVLKKTYQKNNDYNNAFIIQKKFDSIGLIYNSTENNAKLEILEQNITNEKHALKLKNIKYEKYLLYLFILLLTITAVFIAKLYFVNKKLRILA